MLNLLPLRQATEKDADVFRTITANNCAVMAAPVTQHQAQITCVLAFAYATSRVLAGS